MDYKRALQIGAIVGTAAVYTACDDTFYNTPKEIKAEGFPKGYHIENVDIPTRGNIMRVEKLPGEHYQIKKQDGYITFKGNFEYEIEPLRTAMPKDPEHSDMRGRTPDNNKYWEAVRPGTVTLHRDGSLADKL